MFKILKLRILSGNGSLKLSNLELKLLIGLLELAIFELNGLDLFHKELLDLLGSFGTVHR
jgi:hypothetical protein